MSSQELRTTLNTAQGLAITGILVLMGVVTAMPVLSVFTPEQLLSYGIEEVDPSALWLLQHRGILQFTLGAFLIVSAFRPGIRIPVALATILVKGAAIPLAAQDPTVWQAQGMGVKILDPISVVLLVLIIIDTLRRSSRIKNTVQRSPSAKPRPGTGK